MMQVAPAGPSRPKESSRSSRRRVGSYGPVVLGGGAGALGSSRAGTSESYPSPFQTSESSLSPRSPNFPVSFPSPTSPSFASAPPSNPASLSPNLAAKPLSMPPHPVRAPSPASGASSASASASVSNNSLSSTASTSSRTFTLKTPHSKLDHSRGSPIIASGSGSFEGALSGSPTPTSLRQQLKEAPISPTPSQRVADPRRTADGVLRAAPAIARSPLPPTPSDSLQARKPSSAPSVARSRVPAPLELPPRNENRLSQDWVQVSFPSLNNAGDATQRSASTRTPAATATAMDDSPPRMARHPQQGRLPPAAFVAMKDGHSPSRPSFERASTAPSTSSSLAVPEAPRPRSSLDQLRSTSPTPARGRQTSLSTPPSTILDPAQTQQPTGPRMNLLRTASRQGSTGSTPPLRARRSEDLLRPSTDALRPSLDSWRPSVDALREPSKKELKAMQKAAQRDLGVANGTSTPDDKETGRKTSGLSLKKSSGALKALFTRGASGKSKDKERETTPPLPSSEERGKERCAPRSRLSTAEERPRPSFSSVGRPRTPGSPSPNPGASSSPAMAPTQGRSSFSTERTMYPAVPVGQRLPPPPTLLSVSEPPEAPRQRIPSRDLPPLPPPSPVPPADASSASGPTQPAPSTLHTKVDPSSLPYLGVRASVLLENRSPSPHVENRSETVSPASSVSTTRPAYTPLGKNEAAGGSLDLDISPIMKPSKSLHLLSLPDLDLDFDVAFDKIGHSPSPSTPRRSPRRSPRSPHTPQSPMAPQRSLSTRITPHSSASPSLGKSKTERRRSKSFDGTGSPSGEDMWRKLFASNTSSSAPILSKQLSEPIPPAAAQTQIQTQTRVAQEVEEPAMIPTQRPVRVRQHNHSFSSQPSLPSSSDHVRTPSNASSTNETATPSPPHTPDDRLQRVAYPFPSPDRKMSKLNQTPVDDAEAASRPFSLGEPPNIPLPDVPTVEEPVTTPATAEVPPAPAAQIEAPVVQPIQMEPKKPTPPPARIRTLVNKSRVVVPETPMTVRILARDIDRLFYSFKYPAPQTTSADRANLVRNELLPLMLEIEKRPYNPAEEADNVVLREACFAWADALLLDLQVEQPANERGACLEGLAAIQESACLSEIALEAAPAHQKKFTRMMVRCMTFVMGKLGAKGVFHNTLLFSGRFLAFAFFRIPHVGEQLVTVLQPPKGALMRFTRPILLGATVPGEAQPKFPDHLRALCFDNSRSYSARLSSVSAEFTSEEEHEAFLFQPGNWLRRWQSDDSELFPAFYRAYHRQLARYLAPVVEHFEGLNQPVPASVLLRAPGYAHLATIFAKKCHSYILGSVNAVTTSSSSQNFEAQETAGFRGSQKPAVLETANRRLVETISTFANLRVMIPLTATNRVIEVDGTQLWGDVIDVWTKNLISRTSLYAPKGVFSLFDLLDGIVDPPYETVGERSTDSLLDVSHLIYVIRLVLTQGEHALTLVKVIAFVFTHWEVLTARAEDRRELCLELLLKKELFERLLLFWSQSVRSYVLRLVVFRLGHLHTTKEDGVDHEVEIESVRLLQARLDRIKQRHDELEPRPASLNEIEEEVDANPPLTPVDGTFGGGLTRSRSTITMISDSPQPHVGSANKAERLLGLGFGMDTAPRGEIEDNKTGKGSWWKKKLGGGKQKKRSPNPDASPSSSPSPSPSPALQASPSLQASPFIGSSSNASPASRNTPKMPAPPRLQAAAPITKLANSPQIVSPVSSNSSASSGSPISETTRKARPPTITTTAPLTEDDLPSPSKFAFEFELPTMSPRSDTFDPTPTPTSPRRNSEPPSPHQPQSPHMSRSFSKRSSLLPPSTASALEGIMASEATKKQEKEKKQERIKEQEEGYAPKLHAYAIRMLAELEDAQKEYDEWWSETGVGRMDGAPPRLTVAWPFHDGED